MGFLINIILNVRKKFFRSHSNCASNNTHHVTSQRRRMAAFSRNSENTAPTNRWAPQSPNASGIFQYKHIWIASGWSLPLNYTPRVIAYIFPSSKNTQVKEVKEFSVFRFASLNRAHINQVHCSIHLNKKKNPKKQKQNQHFCMATISTEPKKRLIRKCAR